MVAAKALLPPLKRRKEREVAPARVRFRRSAREKEEGEEEESLSLLLSADMWHLDIERRGCGVGGEGRREGGRDREVEKG